MVLARLSPKWLSLCPFVVPLLFLLLSSLPVANAVSDNDLSSTFVDCRSDLLDVPDQTPIVDDCVAAMSDITTDLPQASITWQSRAAARGWSDTLADVPRVFTNGRCRISVTWNNGVAPAENVRAWPQSIRDVAEKITQKCISMNRSRGGGAAVGGQTGQGTPLRVQVAYYEDPQTQWLRALARP